MSYLAELMLRLAAGAGALPETVRRRHADYVAAAQGDDGGFAGRRGPSDPYYTSFALRTLALTGQLGPDTAEPAAAFLEAQLGKKLTPVDFLALVGSAALVELATGEDVFARAGQDRQQLLLKQVAPLLRDDGGFAKTPRSGPSSTYQTFLVAAAKETVGLPLDDTAGIARMVLARQRDDGGFVELPAVRDSGTNPTAARFGGVNDRFVMFAAMALSGALAGLAGASEVSGIHQRLQDNFAPGFGVAAIAVALLARLNPLAVPLAALLFGVLHVGSGVLQRESGIPIPIVWIIEGVVILAFLVFDYLRVRKTGG